MYKWLQLCSVLSVCVICAIVTVVGNEGVGERIAVKSQVELGSVEEWPSGLFGSAKWEGNPWWRQMCGAQMLWSVCHIGW